MFGDGHWLGRSFVRLLARVACPHHHYCRCCPPLSSSLGAICIFDCLPLSFSYLPSTLNLLRYPTGGDKEEEERELVSQSTTGSSGGRAEEDDDDRSTEREADGRTHEDSVAGDLVEQY